MSTPISAGSYLVCATPRSGSTLFCGLLRSSRVAGRPESYFRAPDESSWAERWRIRRNPTGSLDYRDYLQAAIRQGSTENGVFAARVMWGTIDEMVTKLTGVYPDVAGVDLELLTRAFGSIRFVYLWRGDIVAQAVSWTRAEQTGYWQHGDIVGREPRFDFEQIHGFVQMINEHNLAWRAWFSSVEVRPHVVRYEDLVADMVGVTRGVIDFLGLKVPTDLAIVARHERLADEVSAEWIARYRAIWGSAGSFRQRLIRSEDSRTKSRRADAER